MSFDVAAESYQRFMGRFAEPLADTFAPLGGLHRGQRALDVGCGPGALSERLSALLGADAVAAVDPSPSFVEAARARLPGVEVRRAAAENLPFADGVFDAALAQLVVHFMDDPVAGLSEMARVTTPGGRVAACVWDHAGGTGPLTAFWDAVHDTDPAAPDESGLAGSREGELPRLLSRAGLADVVAVTLTVRVEFASFEDWWTPFTLGVGPAGAYVAGLVPDAVTTLREHCQTLLPEPPFAVDATAWGAYGRV